MGLLKFKAFNTMLKEIKLEKESQKKATVYKKAYLEKLTAYGVKDASELDDIRLAEFLEYMKTYRNGGNPISEGNI
jgi:hypothetical protein